MNSKKINPIHDFGSVEKIDLVKDITIIVNTQIKLAEMYEKAVTDNARKEILESMKTINEYLKLVGRTKVFV